MAKLRIKHLFVSVLLAAATASIIVQVLISANCLTGKRILGQADSFSRMCSR